MLAADARAVFMAAVAAARPDRLLDRVDLDALLGGAGRVRLLAVGKAALGLAGAAGVRLGDRIFEGLAVVPHGYAATLPSGWAHPAGSAVMEAGHPAPDAASVEAGERALGMGRASAADGTPLLVLLSGGGSALVERPADGLTLEDLVETNRLLLFAGVAVGRVNVVRKHLSAIKGGRLVAQTYPAHVIALVLSDVVGDSLAVIASGPTVGDPSSFADALGVLDEVALRERVPRPVRLHLERGAAGLRGDTPKPGDPRLAHAATHLLGSNHDALAGAADEARCRGYRVEIRTRELNGEAREVGSALARDLRTAAGRSPACLLWGGETTVTVRGPGRGGRCQELALAAALALDGAPGPLVLLAAGTDGVDGPTPAAGAIVTERTAARARDAGLDPEVALFANDAFGLFYALGPSPDGGGLVVTGPTHTNVMDLVVGLVGA